MSQNRTLDLRSEQPRRREIKLKPTKAKAASVDRKNDIKENNFAYGKPYEVDNKLSSSDSSIVEFTDLDFKLNSHSEDLSPTIEKVLQVIERLPGAVKNIKSIEIPEDPLEEDFKMRSPRRKASPKPEVRSKSPEVRSKSPEVRSKSPEVRSKSPEVRSKSPEVRSKSPEVRSKSPEVRSKSPEVRSKSPEVRSKSPEVRSKSPEVRSKSPEVRSKSPEVRSKSPEVRSKSPEVRSKSPEVRSKSPEVRSKSPEVRSKSPEVRSKSPEVRSKSPDIQVPTVDNIRQFSEMRGSRPSSRLDEIRDKIEIEKRKSEDMKERRKMESTRSSRFSDAMQIKEQLELQKREFEEFKLKNAQEALERELKIKTLYEEKEAELELKRLENENKLNEEYLNIEKMKEGIKEFYQKDKEIKEKIYLDHKYNVTIRKFEKDYEIKFPEDPEERLRYYEVIKSYENKNNIHKNIRRIFLFSCIAIEFGFANILGIDVNGFVDDQIDQLEEFDEIFEDILERYLSNGGPKMDPFLKLSLVMTLNFTLLIMSNYAKRINILSPYGEGIHGGVKNVGSLLKSTFLGVEKKNESLSISDKIVLFGYKQFKGVEMKNDTNKRQKQGPIYTG